MRQYRTAAVLAAIILVLGALATWDEWQTKKDEEAEKSKNKLVDIKVEDIVGLDYLSRQEETSEKVVEISLVKTDAVWRISQPVDALADSAAVENLVKTLTDYSYTKVVGDQQTVWKDFGLHQPQRQIVLRLKDGVPLEISVGIKSPVGYSVYSKTSLSEKVFIGSQYLLTSTTKTLFEFRDKDVVEIDEKTLKGFVYRRKGEQAIEIERRDGKYVITKPDEFAADGPGIRDFLDLFNLEKATGFIDSPEAKIQDLFTEPDFVLTWTDEKGQATTLALAAADSKLYAAIDPKRLVYEIDTAFSDKVKKDLIDFRDRRIFPWQSDDITEVEIDGDLYKNVAGTWYTAKDAEKLNADGKSKDDSKQVEESDHIRALVVDLEFARTDAFIELASDTAKNLGPAEHRVKIRFRDGVEPVRMSIDIFSSEKEPKKRLLRYDGSPYIYQIPEALLDNMTPASADTASGDVVDDTDAG